MLYNYKMRSTFSDYSRFPKIMTHMRYVHEEYDNFTDYRIEKNTFKFNSRKSEIISDTKKLLIEDKITDYKPSQISYERYRKRRRIGFP